MDKLVIENDVLIIDDDVVVYDPFVNLGQVVNVVASVLTVIIFLVRGFTFGDKGSRMYASQ